MSSSNSYRRPTLPALQGATGVVRGLFGLTNNSKEEQEFTEIVSALERYEAGKSDELERLTTEYYSYWAGAFNKLKSEFNQLWSFFEEIEQRVPGWYCVSPSLAPWKSVNYVREGYTFSACIMKNHHRDAPLSEKSLTVSFGLDEIPQGIGDESWVGRTGETTDELIGLANCKSLSLKQQYEGAKKLKERINNMQIHFRLNHQKIGQQSSKLPLSVLNAHSLQDLSRKLFVLLNNDILTELQAKLENPEKYLLLEDPKEDQYLSADLPLLPTGKKSQ